MEMIASRVREESRAETLWVTPIRLRAQRRVLWLREIWAIQQEEVEQGTAGLHREIDRLLSDKVEILAAEAAFYLRNREAHGLDCAIAQSDARLNGAAAWRRLAAEFGLTVPEQQFLLLAAAAEIEPPLRRVFGYLTDEPQPCWPSPALAAELFSWPASVRIGSGSALLRGRLAYPCDSNANLSHTIEWQPDTALVAYLLRQADENRDEPDSLQSHSTAPAEFLAAYRSRSRPEDSDLFTALPCPYEWNDLILPPGVQAHLEEFEAQVRLRHAVYDEWGMGFLTPMGRGISALFAGPSGTGKTMAAQVLARSLGMELLRVDLAEVMNKYIGETEKRLKKSSQPARIGTLCCFSTRPMRSLGSGPRSRMLTTGLLTSKSIICYSAWSSSTVLLFWPRPQIGFRQGLSAAAPFPGGFCAARRAGETGALAARPARIRPERRADAGGDQLAIFGAETRYDGRRHQKHRPGCGLPGAVGGSAHWHDASAGAARREMSKHGLRIAPR